MVMNGVKFAPVSYVIYFLNSAQSEDLANTLEPQFGLIFSIFYDPDVTHMYFCTN